MDHKLAVSVAKARYHKMGDRKSLLRAYMLENQKLLCHSCHVSKTGQDIRRLNNLRAGRPEFQGLGVELG